MGGLINGETMSHVSAGTEFIDQTELDLQAVDMACKELGLELCRDVKTYHWFGRWVNDYHGADAAYKVMDPANFGKCKHMIRIAQTEKEKAQYEKNPSSRPYEIGLVEMPNGQLGFVFDHYGSGAKIAAKVGGKTCANLMTHITKNKVILTAATQAGHTIKRVEVLGQNKIHLVVGVKATDSLSRPKI